MNTYQYAVILVYSTNYVWQAEKILKKSGILCHVIPVPRHLGSDCGSCLRILQADKERAIQELKTTDIGIRKIVSVNNSVLAL